jgi:hypothetical protein
MAWQRYDGNATRRLPPPVLTPLLTAVLTALHAGLLFTVLPGAGPAQAVGAQASAADGTDLLNTPAHRFEPSQGATAPLWPNRGLSSIPFRSTPWAIKSLPKPTAKPPPP